MPPPDLEKLPMKPVTFIFLTISGLLLLAIGGTILFVPHAFYASDGIVLGNDPSLLSEIRAPGGLLATSGLFILIGVFRLTLRSLALMLTVLVYCSFGLSRLLSFYLDGIPSHSLAIATVIELVMAGIGLVMLRTITGGSPNDCSRSPGCRPPVGQPIAERNTEFLRHCPVVPCPK
jgi:hypothetical protein